VKLIGLPTANDASVSKQIPDALTSRVMPVAVPKSTGSEALSCSSFLFSESVAAGDGVVAGAVVYVVVAGAGLDGIVTVTGGNDVIQFRTIDVVTSARTAVV
jgi:hypothetical protein